MGDDFSVEMWFWNTDEKKWFRDMLDVEDIAQLRTYVEERCFDYAYIDSVTKMKAVQIGTKDAGGRAFVFNVDGAAEEEDERTGDYVDRKLKFVVLANVDMTKKKFLELRRSLQDLVKAGAFTLKEDR